MIDSSKLVTKNSAASVQVVVVSTLPVPRLVMNPPPPPMPRPPPSDFCSSTTPIKASTSIRWITMTTCCIRPKSVHTSQSRLPAQAALRDVYRNSPRSLHDHGRLFHPRRLVHWRVIPKTGSHFSGSRATVNGGNTDEIG